MAGTRQPKNDREVITITATTASIDPSYAGKMVCNLGASGGLIATLTTAATGWIPGDSVMFINCVDQTFSIAATAGQLITFNNAAATSVTLSTSGEKIGGSFLVTCVSNGKFHVANLCEETQTVTVA